MGKLKVAVVFGGRSGEHEISLMSAKSIMSAIDREKYEVIPVGISKDGVWYLGASPEAGTITGQAVRLIGRDLVSLDEGTALEHLVRVDVVFPALHGTFGEDGTIQGLFEMNSVPYVGAGVMSSAVCMDKSIMKAVFREAGIPVAPIRTFLRKAVRQDAGRVVSQIEAEFNYPVFVKPANLGSSVGVSKAKNREQLFSALDLACMYDRKIVVEQGIDAREVECSVLGNDDPEASLAGEIIPSREFYDYYAKYIDDKSELLIPAPIPEAIHSEVRQLAIRAFKAVDCSGMARVDFFIERGTNQVYVNEINTIPGFTRISMYPKLWEATGISYPELMDRLITLGIERYEDRSASKTTFEP
ncbi:MAG: D-alanine--D-alanine ligase family protein [Bacillota bacterium]